MHAQSLFRVPSGVLLGLVLFASAGLHSAARGDETPAETGTPTALDFDHDVAPILAGRCLGCHNAADRKGGLNLGERQAALAGGDNGPVLTPGNASTSVLLRRVVEGEMPPPKQVALTPSEIETLRTWIDAGAGWGADPIDPRRYSSATRAGYDWWALQPTKLVAPSVAKDSSWIRNPIDGYVLAKLESADLSPSQEANRTTLIRRLSFDLLGLPPTPEEVTAFVEDTRPDAYESLVDRMLASPHYGERWARHWLDVVRYGESQGFERDKVRDNAWRYRDWVVDALNSDIDYREFVRLQLAGDLLSPGEPAATIATGFLVAGPWDEVGNLQQSAAMRAVVRQDELEELVGTTCQTFLGLTANCARCHDHKFDPISQLDFYRLAAALGGVRHGERDIGPGPMGSATTPEDAEIEAARQALASFDEEPRRRALARRELASGPNAKIPLAQAPVPLARYEFESDARDQLGALHGEIHGDAQIEGGRLRLKGGYLTTAPLAAPLAEKTLEVWVAVDGLDQHGGGVFGVETLDGAVFDAIVYGEREPRKWLPGSNGYVRTENVGGDEETSTGGELVHLAIVYRGDGEIAFYRNGQPYGRPYRVAKTQSFEAKQAHLVFGLRHLPPGGDKTFVGEIERACLHARALTDDEIAASAGDLNRGVREDELLAVLTPKERDQRNGLLLALSRRLAQRSLRRGGKSYVVSPAPIEECRLLVRGDPKLPGEVVSPGGIAALGKSTQGALADDFGLAPDSLDVDRRVRLADWLTDEANPLLARVIANRLWHYHFGVGIVDTPNDFGFNGGRPSHPELLDWLALELARNDWRLKGLHRAIVLSATYRQSSRHRPEGARLDAGNRLLWRKSPLRLEAEEIRDATLSAAGELRAEMGGPGFRDFRTFTFNSQFYEVYDPVGSAFHRRGVYRTWIRSGTSPLLDAFDCPDPSAAAPRRAVTTTPLQSLALLNNSFMLRMTESFAARVSAEAPSDVAARVDRALRLTYGRPPRPDETEKLREFVDRHGLAALARALFNSNEFLYVD